jgi:hypothetical protein
MRYDLRSGGNINERQIIDFRFLDLPRDGYHDAAIASSTAETEKSCELGDGANSHHPSLLRRRSDCKGRLQPRCQTLLALAQKFKIAPRKRIDFEFAFANAGSAVMPPVRLAVEARLSNAPPMCLRRLALAK